MGHVETHVFVGLKKNPARQESQKVELVQDLHGKGHCTHVLAAVNVALLWLKNPEKQSVQKVELFRQSLQLLSHLRHTVKSDVGT